MSLPARSFHSAIAGADNPSEVSGGAESSGNHLNRAVCDRKEAMAAITSQSLRLLVLALVALNAVLVAEVR